MKKLFLIALPLVGFVTRVHAQENLTPPIVDTQTQLKQVRDLIRVDALWNKPLDWKEKGSSTANIVAHVRKALGAGTNIEIRVKESCLSTFALDQTRLGPTLTSVASLANGKVWVFPSGLVIAPEILLTDSERDLIKNGMGGEWQGGAAAGGDFIESSMMGEWQGGTTGSQRWNAQRQLTQVAVPVVGADLKARLALKGVAPPAALVAAPVSQAQTPEESRAASLAYFNRHSPYELPLSELSPSTKELVQDLVKIRNNEIRLMSMDPNILDVYKIAMPKLEISDSTIVGLDDTGKEQIELRLQNPDKKNSLGRREIGRWAILKPTQSVTPTAQ